ncbi:MULTISPECIES: tyrosine-type recombinase/integrase [unclassified Methylobacterium]|uniref:tyrosine-type recombinase/integrase n=1 Tax=unclassified Methylobacterium TaxID=2615210 RepID=UPI0012379E01|nr:tyrosine-type recombinase/integrase [Methylobacterium sp. 4-46]
MPSVLLDTGLLRITVRYVRPLKRGGPLFYYRRIPVDLLSHYPGKRFRRISLSTRDMAVAAQKATQLAAQDDALWTSLRSREGQAAKLTTPENRLAAVAILNAIGVAPGDLAPGRGWVDGPDAGDAFDAYFERRYGQAYTELRHNTNAPREWLEDQWTPAEREAVRLAKEDPGKPRALLSDALAAYLQNHDKGNQPKFVADTKRSLGHVFTLVGDFPLNTYERKHANAVRDGLLKEGNKTTTVRRHLNSIRAVFNFGLREYNLRSHGNPFEGLKIPREAEDAGGRKPFTSEELRTISAACLQKGDDIRQIMALQADTGARIAEIVGLRVGDVVLDHETPHINIRPHLALGRTLKNANSERLVPLVGLAVWAARKAVEAAQQAPESSGWLFPRYAADRNIKAASAAQTINKWLSEALKIEKTTHSFRHAMRDRLRHADVPEEFQNLIGGWGTRSIGQGYGQGYRLGQLREQLEKVVLAKELRFS